MKNNKKSAISLTQYPTPNSIKNISQERETVEENSNNHLKRTGAIIKIVKYTNHLLANLRKVRYSIDRGSVPIEKDDMMELKQMVKYMLKTSTEMMDQLAKRPSMEAPIDSHFSKLLLSPVQLNPCLNVNKLGMINTRLSYLSYEKAAIKTQDFSATEDKFEQTKDERETDGEKLDGPKKVSFKKGLQEEEGNSQINVGFEEKINTRLSYMSPESKLNVPEILGNQVEGSRISLDKRLEYIRFMNSENYQQTIQNFYNNNYYYVCTNNYNNNYCYQIPNYQQYYDPTFVAQYPGYPGYYCYTF